MATRLPIASAAVMAESLYSIDDLLEQMVARNASDLHITVGAHPVVRVRGRLEPLQDIAPLTGEMTQQLLYRILSTEQQKQLEIGRQIDLAHSIPGLARFRVNVYWQRETLLGEMRDLETISTALTAAETGHLVFATLHTQSAPGTIDRVIDAFPSGQQDQVRIQLAATLEGVVTQALLPTADGTGRVPALEILFPDDAVRNLIRQAKVEQVYSVMQTGTAKGMQTMEQSLADLTLRGVISIETAIGRSSRPEQLTGLPERAGFDLGTDDEPAPSLRIAEA